MWVGSGGPRYVDGGGWGEDFALLVGWGRALCLFG